MNDWILLVFVVLFLILLVYLLWRFIPKRTRMRMGMGISGKFNRQSALILGTWNEDAGFFYNIYSNLNALWGWEKLAACREQIRPVVIFTSGLYAESRPDYTALIPNYNPMNWYTHFFLPVNMTDKSDEHWYNLIKTYRIPSANMSVLTHPQPATVHWFDRTLLDGVVGRMGSGRTAIYHEMWSRYCVPQPYITAMVNRFCGEHFPTDHHIISVHIRLTDKNPSCGTGPGMKKIKDGASEDFPKKVTSQFVIFLLKREIALRNWEGMCTVFVATDETDMLEELKRNSGLPIVHTDCIRSSINTSGKNIDTGLCDRGDFSTPECVEYNRMIDASIHRGYKHLSGYQKGLEAMLDMLLLNKGELFLRSRGNFSNFPVYMNPSRPVIDMVSEWTENEGDQDEADEPKQSSDR